MKKALAGPTTLVVHLRITGLMIIFEKMP